MSTTEYRLSRRRARTQDGEDGGGIDPGERADSAAPTPPEPLASGSQRLDARVTLPIEPWAAPPPGRDNEAFSPDASTGAWSPFDVETAEILLPELAVPPTAPVTRVETAPMPPDHLAAALAATLDDLDGVTVRGSLSPIRSTAVRGMPVLKRPPPTMTTPLSDDVITEDALLTSDTVATVDGELSDEDEAEIARAAAAAAPVPQVVRDRRHTARGVVADPRMPVTSVRFGDQQILIVHRGEQIDLVLPGGQRMTGHRDSATALADALLRGFTPR